RFLKRAGVYQHQPGWARHWLRLGVACAAMVVVLLFGLWIWPHWTEVRILTRAWHLAVLVTAAGSVYLLTLLATGFRMRDLRAH
ncbi:MAG: murein biosynthesis integral membrane protein MurJ, partial [Pseudomonadota bacterium]|nr:murein biosynthesis integral membrane protein MurJ [Pseudomonadota bacterium]